MERHVPVVIFMLVAVFGVATLLLSVTYYPETVPFAVQLFPQDVTPKGQNTVVVRLDVNEPIANEIEGMSGDLVPALRSGTIHAKDVRTDYTQAVMFAEPGVFSGGAVVFGRDEQNRVTDFLRFQDVVFKYQIEFAPGLRSEVDNGALPDIEDEDFEMLGSRFTIVDTDVNTGAGRVSLRMFGGYGSIEFEDVYTDNAYSDGVRINGKRIDARVKIRATMSGDKVTIYSIQYLLDANAVRGGDVEVLPRHCTREYLQYPLGLLSPNFDLCYTGVRGEAVPTTSAQISGNEVRIRPHGDDEYAMYATNFHGQTYEIPLAQQPGMYGNDGRDFVFVEAAAPGAPNIALGDYFLVMSREKNGVTHVLRYDNIQGTTVYFEDLATGDQKPATFDAGSGEGQLLFGEGTYQFVVGAGDALAMDQTNDGNIDGDEAKWVFPGGTIADFGPGFTVRIITPRRLFDEATTDEVTDFDILFGGNIDLDVPSPQITLPGYEFKMVSSSGGVRQGLTKYGILFTWDQESESDYLELVIPGAYARSAKGGAMGEVYITFERERWMKQTQAPAPAPQCGDGIITAPEVCDPPGSLCADPYFSRSGTCADDCSSCRLPACGNKLLEKGEQCEAPADCEEGFTCQSCECVPLPEPVCGNNLIERGEQCEKDVDCGNGMVCDACQCQPAPPEVEAPTPPPPQPNVFARFFTWLAGLFGA